MTYIPTVIINSQNNYHMENIRNLELFSLLSDAPIVTNEKVENAYGCFAEHMKAVSQSETDYSEVFRMLNDTRVELAFLQSLYRHEQEKNALKSAYLRKAILFLESEIELLLKVSYRTLQRYRTSSKRRFLPFRLRKE